MNLPNIPTRLWELSGEIAKLESVIVALLEDESLTNEEREIQLEQAVALRLKTSENFSTKAEQLAAYIRHQEALAEARKAEAKRIYALAKQAENQANRLRQYLLNQMVATGNTRIDGVSVKVGVRKKPPLVKINCNLSELPDEYVKIEYTPKLAEIRKLLKSPKRVEWATFETNRGYSLTIK